MFLYFASYRTTSFSKFEHLENGTRGMIGTDIVAMLCDHFFIPLNQRCLAAWNSNNQFGIIILSDKGIIAFAVLATFSLLFVRIEFWLFSSCCKLRMKSAGVRTGGSTCGLMPTCTMSWNHRCWINLLWPFLGSSEQDCPPNRHLLQLSNCTALFLFKLKKCRQKGGLTKKRAPGCYDN